MKPTLWRYPLDRTAASPNNYVAYERHEIGNNERRAIAPLYGTYVADSLVLYDVQNLRPLTRSEYKLFLLNREASKYIGKDAYYLVVITSKAVGSVVDISYQAVGGEHTSYRHAIALLSDTALIDERPVMWEDIDGKPSAFKPSKHMHDVGDIYGMHYTTHLVDQLTELTKLRDVMSHDPIYQFMDNQYGDFKTEMDQLMLVLNQHINNTSDPHRVTPTQLNAYVYSEFDALLAQLKNSYDLVVSAESSRANYHITNYNNPHQLTAGKIGAYTAAEMEALLQNVMANLPPGNDGKYEYRPGTTGGSYAYSWSDTNDQPGACFYSLSVRGTSDRRVACRVYVNGVATSPNFNYHTRDPKCIQGTVFVPAGQTISVDMNTGDTPCRMIAYRFVPKATQTAPPPVLPPEPVPPLPVVAGWLLVSVPTGGAAGYSDGGGNDGISYSDWKFGQFSGDNGSGGSNNGRLDGYVCNFFYSIDNTLYIGIKDGGAHNGRRMRMYLDDPSGQLILDSTIEYFREQGSIFQYRVTRPLTSYGGRYIYISFD